MSSRLKSRIERLEKKMERLTSTDGPSARHLEAVRLRDDEHLTFTEIGKRFGVSRERARQFVVSGRMVPKYIDRVTVKLESAKSDVVLLAGISTRISCILSRHGINSWDRINAMTDEDLLSIHNVGTLTVQEIRAAASSLEG